MNDEDRLKAKLSAIEALFAGATTTGERVAAERAQQRIVARLAALPRDHGEVEWQFSLTPWSRRLLLALARRYGIKPYRYKRPRRTTLVIRASERFLKETFLPLYDQMCDSLYEHLDAVTERVVAEAIHADKSDALMVDGRPQQLEVFVTEKSKAGK